MFWMTTCLPQLTFNFQESSSSLLSIGALMNTMATTTWWSTTLVTRVGKKSFYTHFAPPQPYAMLTKHFHLTQVCILPFSNIERGDGGVDTYSVDSTIIISCFWHFPTQFVQDCLSFHMLLMPINYTEIYIFKPNAAHALSITCSIKWPLISGYCLIPLLDSQILFSLQTEVSSVSISCNKQ